MPSAPQALNNPILRLENLNTRVGADFLLKDIDLSVGVGQRVALVGESGSGKSSLASLILRLSPSIAPISGQILFKGQDLLRLSEGALRALRGQHIGYIAQEPLSALNPLHKIQKQILEALCLHAKPSKQEAQERLEAVMAQVGLSMDLCQRYPYELSGGQNQRAALAMALINRPKLLICDEPTTALDAQVQLQILELLKTLSVQHQMALLFISHDLGAVGLLADSVYVLQKGQICEHNATKELFNAPKHPYTQMLLGARKLEKKRAPALDQPTLSVRDFSVFYTKSKFFKKDIFEAIKGVNFNLRQQETLGIIGQSGSGKSSLAMGLLKLAQSQGVQVLLGQSVGGLSRQSFKPYRKSLQMVFQNPFASLNPRWSVQEILLEAFVGAGLKGDIKQAQESLEAVGLEAKHLHHYPFELSGGQRQRVAIARAILTRPQVVVMDEPTSALDKSLQKVVLALLLELQERLQLSFVFISHDLDVIECMCDRVLVVHKGAVVESGAVTEVFKNPKHPYTRELLETRL
ncbi:Oligopeptide permease ATPase protein OppD [Helicobacter sp. NHP21005]|nr:Oligopeptide permease ATPase protein OppD [Helicobacter sp. NHP21005]